MAHESFLKTAVPLVALTFYGIYNLPPLTQDEQAHAAAVEQSVYYSGCDEVRDSGEAPLYRGSPGYREGMDGDGIAFEPYHGN